MNNEQCCVSCKSCSHGVSSTGCKPQHAAWCPPCAPFLPAQAHKPIAASLRLFADAENFPILVHCVHGKDRTGLIAMLLLGLLDVDKQARPPIPRSLPFQAVMCYPSHGGEESLSGAEMGFVELRKAGYMMLPASPHGRQHALVCEPQQMDGRLHLHLLHLRGVAEGVDCLEQAVVRDYALSEALLKAGRDAGRLSELGGMS